MRSRFRDARRVRRFVRRQRPEGLGRNSKVWVAVAAPGDDDAADMYRPATVVSLGADTAEVRLNDELAVSVPLAKVFPANPDILEGAEDLTQLSYLNEPSILHDLHHRYGADDIYTRAGPVLIAVNPFKSVAPSTPPTSSPRTAPAPLENLTCTASPPPRTTT